MAAMHIPCRYLLPDKNQWPHQLSFQESPIPLALYGQADPPTYEDLMFLFDQITRLAPQSLNLHIKGQRSDDPDLFFYHYLSRYLDIPFTLFDVFFHAQPPVLTPESTHVPGNATSEKPEKFRHFRLYLEKNRSPPQGQVKPWIRELYLS